MDITSIIIAVSAFGFSIASFSISYHRGRKMEQIKTVIEISNKLDETENKFLAIEDKMREMQIKNKILEDEDYSALERQHKDEYLLYMNHWEFFSFLVNQKEIHNENIKKFFKKNFKSGTKRFFTKYPNYKNNDEDFEEVKKLLKKWYDDK